MLADGFRAREGLIRGRENWVDGEPGREARMVDGGWAEKMKMVAE